LQVCSTSLAESLSLKRLAAALRTKHLRLLQAEP
jgi:hypothetical protein